MKQEVLTDVHIRRAALAGGAATVCASLLVGLPADAAKRDYEPMSALKDKDYGKERQRYSIHRVCTLPMLACQNRPPHCT